MTKNLTDTEDFLDFLHVCIQVDQYYKLSLLDTSFLSASMVNWHLYTGSR